MKTGNQKPRKNRNLNKKPNAFDQAMNNVNIIIIMRELFTGIQPLQSIYQQSTEDLIIVPEEKANAINLNHVKVEGSTDDRSQKLKGARKAEEKSRYDYVPSLQCRQSRNVTQNRQKKVKYLLFKMIKLTNRGIKKRQLFGKQRQGDIVSMPNLSVRETQIIFETDKSQNNSTNVKNDQI